jgi:hypothetical protein
MLCALGLGAVSCDLWKRRGHVLKTGLPLRPVSGAGQGQGIWGSARAASSWRGMSGLSSSARRGGCSSWSRQGPDVTMSWPACLDLGPLRPMTSWWGEGVENWGRLGILQSLRSRVRKKPIFLYYNHFAFSFQVPQLVCGWDNADHKGYFWVTRFPIV